MSVVEEQDRAAEAEWLAAWLSGPTRTRVGVLPAQIGDPAPDAELPDTGGRPRRLSEFWRERPALLLFLRQFGCSCLAERWDRLKEEIAAYVEEGAQLVAVCQAEPERAAAVARRRGYPFPLLCDPERRAYELFGLPEGTPAQILHDFAWRPGDQATGEKMVVSRRGTERAPVDSPWQLPGEFVIAPSGRLILTHRYQYCEDFPPKTVLIGAIRTARAAAG